jgi:LysM repeat protein
MPAKNRFRALAVGAGLALLVTLFSVDYTVERGDTLGKIAREHGISLAELVEANDITNPNLIHIGQVLIVPGGEGESEVIHIVARGETLGKIARKYGSSVSALAEKNGISRPNLIRIGQNLIVSGSASVGSSVETSDGDDVKPPSTPTPHSGSHKVEAGESIESIAADHGVSVEQIARANGILDGVIYARYNLLLDGPGYVAEGNGEGESSYTVKNGDRLGDIAARHGTTISQISGANNISNANLIRVGQVLIVPGGSSWVCPVRNARFFNGWGAPRGGGIRWHKGIDLGSFRGAEVYAPTPGTVSFKTGSIGGKQFNLRGDDGVMYIGAHMEDFGKSGRVNAGDVIGYVGSSGNAQGTSPHLHFGMFPNSGDAVNPYPSLIVNGCK